MLRIASQMVLVAGSIAIGAAGAIALRADLMVGYGFSKALEARKAAQPFALATPASRQANAEVGDEVYWLARHRGVATPVALGKRLTVGDRIAITGEDGRARRLEVVDLSLIGAPIYHVADGSLPARLVQVTCRVLGAAGRGGNEELVRLFIEAEEPKPATLPAHGGHVLRQG